MLEGIEGVGNLFNISKIAKSRDDIDAAKVEEYRLLSCEPATDYDIAGIYEEIMSILNCNVEPVDFSPEIKKKPTSSSKPIINENLLASTFQPTFKQPVQAPIMTNYEKQQFNKIVYNSGEKEDDAERITLIESVDALRDELTRMEIKVNSIPQVDENSSLADIKHAYKMLLHKKNVNVHFETSRDLILVGINQLVNYCDGRETAWGRRPNLIGWDRTAKLKLNALKTELSNLASNFFKEYEIGPLAQIALSLIPSMLMHATLRSQQTSIQSDNQNALENLQDMM